MRAFGTVWRAIVSYYNELFLLIGLSLFWWVTGGIFVGIAGLAGWIILQGGGGPVWLAPLLAIPAGPASAAMACVARPVARDRHVDRTFYTSGLRTYWRQALALSAISMAVLAVLILNVQFYLSSTNQALQIFGVFWAYLTVLWGTVQLYLWPVLVGLEVPTILNTLRTAGILAFASPLFALILLILALVLTGISVATALPLFVVWPALIILVGEQALMLMMQKLGGSKPNPDGDGPG